MSDLLDDAAIADALRSLDGWTYRDGALHKTYDRGGFDGSIAFVNAVAQAANRANHHPDLAISWNTVDVTLSSHDSGGVTPRDTALAAQIDTLANPPA